MVQERAPEYRVSWSDQLAAAGNLMRVVEHESKHGNAISVLPYVSLLLARTVSLHKTLGEVAERELEGRQ